MGHSSATDWMNGKRFAGEMVAISVPAGLPVQENIKIVASQVQSQGALCVKLFCPLVAFTSDYSALISRICHPGNRKIRSERSRELCGFAWCALHFIRSINRALLVRRKKVLFWSVLSALCLIGPLWCQHPQQPWPDTSAAGGHAGPHAAGGAPGVGGSQRECWGRGGRHSHAHIPHPPRTHHRPEQHRERCLKPLQPSKSTRETRRDDVHMIKACILYLFWKEAEIRAQGLKHLKVKDRAQGPKSDSTEFEFLITSFSLIKIPMSRFTFLCSGNVVSLFWDNVGFVFLGWPIPSSSEGHRLTQ